MEKVYFGFAIADGMFLDAGEKDCNCGENEEIENVTVYRDSISSDEIKSFLSSLLKENLVICLNPSHVATVNAGKVLFPEFFGEIKIPEKAPIVKLENGDRLVVMSVRGLPRLEGRHEYTDEEINRCIFKFSVYTVYYHYQYRHYFG